MHEPIYLTRAQVKRIGLILREVSEGSRFCVRGAVKMTKITKCFYLLNLIFDPIGVR